MDNNHMPCPKCRRPVLIEIGAKCGVCGTKIPAIDRATYNINRPIESGEFTPSIIAGTIILLAILFMVLT